MAQLPAYAVDGGRVPAAMARRVTYAVSSGANGVVGVGDLKVNALPTPGAGVQVERGTALCASRTSGANEYETYTIAQDSATNVSVPATGGSARTDYLVARVADWHFTGDDAPADPLNALYWEFALVSTLTGITTPYVALARIDLPSNTSTVTAAMITDLRTVAIPRTKTEWRVLNVPTAEQDDLTDTRAYPVGTTFPEAATDHWGPIDIPEWATRMKISMTWASVKIPPGNVTGHLWVQVGMTVNPDKVITKAVAYDTVGASQYTRDTFIAADEVAVPTALRGTAQRFYPRGCVGSVNQGTSPYLHVATTTSMLLQVEFMESAD